MCKNQGPGAGCVCPVCDFLLPVFVLDKRVNRTDRRGLAHARHRAFLICSATCREDTEGLVGNEIPDRKKNISGGGIDACATPSPSFPSRRAQEERLPSARGDCEVAIDAIPPSPDSSSSPQTFGLLCGSTEAATTSIALTWKRMPFLHSPLC